MALMNRIVADGDKVHLFLSTFGGRADNTTDFSGHLAEKIIVHQLGAAEARAESVTGAT